MEALPLLALIAGHDFLTDQIMSMGISEKFVHHNGYQVGLTPDYQRLLNIRAGIRRRVLDELETWVTEPAQAME